MKHKNISVNRPSLRKIEVEYKKLKTALANCTEKPGMRTAQLKARMEYLQTYYKNITTPRVKALPPEITVTENILRVSAQIQRLLEWQKTETDPAKLTNIKAALTVLAEEFEGLLALEKDSSSGKLYAKLQEEIAKSEEALGYFSGFPRLTPEQTTKIATILEGNASENLNGKVEWPGQTVVTTADDTDAEIIPAIATSNEGTL